MSSNTFDTLAYAKKLKAAGVPEQQAEVHAEAIGELLMKSSPPKMICFN